MLIKGNCFHLSTYNLTTSIFPNLKALQNREKLFNLVKKTFKKFPNSKRQICLWWMSKSDHNRVGSYSQGFNLHTKFGTNDDKMKILDY